MSWNSKTLCLSESVKYRGLVITMCGASRNEGCLRALTILVVQINDPVYLERDGDEKKISQNDARPSIARYLYRNQQDAANIIAVLHRVTNRVATPVVTEIALPRVLSTMYGLVGEVLQPGVQLLYTEHWDKVDASLWPNTVVQLTPLDPNKHRIRCPATINNFTVIIPPAVMENAVPFLTAWHAVFPRIVFLLPFYTDDAWKLWNKWNVLRRFHLGVKLTAETPPLLQHWLTEPMQFVYVANSAFVSNSQNSPILRDASVLNSFASVPIFVEDAGHIKYVKWIRRHKPPHQNQLIDPLQPLAHQLALDVYNQFELDTNKYSQYQEAFELALNDLGDRPSLNILVVGPGKGKLIERLMAVISSNCKIYAVEKNPICMEILHKKNHVHWNDSVTLINKDVRFHDFQPTTFDLVISELLGSFGDNELSPEVLVAFTDPSTIMIPSSYANYLQPIFTPILSGASLERPYLCDLTKFYPLDKFKFVWEYNHPLELNSCPTATLQFKCDGYRINGFRGYFRSTLYGHLKITIIKEGNENEYCNSWFPIIFPVNETHVEPGDLVVLTISRHADSTKVWYQWEFDGHVYNRDGKTYSMWLND